MTAIYFLQLIAATVLGVKRFPFAALIAPLLAATGVFHWAASCVFARPWELTSARLAAALDDRESKVRARPPPAVQTGKRRVQKDGIPCVGLDGVRPQWRMGPTPATGKSNDNCTPFPPRMCAATGAGRCAFMSCRPRQHPPHPTPTPTPTPSCPLPTMRPASVRPTSTRPSKSTTRSTMTSSTMQTRCDVLAMPSMPAPSLLASHPGRHPPPPPPPAAALLGGGAPQLRRRRHRRPPCEGRRAPAHLLHSFLYVLMGGDGGGAPMGRRRRPRVGVPGSASGHRLAGAGREPGRGGGPRTGQEPRRRTAPGGPEEPDGAPSATGQPSPRGPAAAPTPQGCPQREGFYLLRSPSCFCSRAELGRRRPFRQLRVCPR
jgi:hypothetical protein